MRLCGCSKRAFQKKTVYQDCAMFWLVLCMAREPYSELYSSLLESQRCNLWNFYDVHHFEKFDQAV